MAKKTRSLLHGEITYSFAKDEEVNILHRLGYVKQRAKFFDVLHHKRAWMRSIVAHHLGASPNACSVAGPEDWIYGSFNVCIPVTVSSSWRRKRQRLMLRFPLPYRVGDHFCPGNSDEKLRCEAGTYAWLQQNATDVPIPHMYGFAVSTGETFTTATCLSFWKRWLFKLRCLALSLLGCPLPSRYVPHQPQSQATDIGYLLIEYIEESAGRMLSNTWSEKRHDDRLRGNLFRSLSQILLSITRTPLPCVGSFVIDNNGYLQLTNRPLSLEIQALENENIPTDMPRNYTYATVDSYILDVLRIHDNRLLHQPNGINNLGDYGAQAAALTILRAALPSFFDPGLRRGPFVLTFTDFNQSNFFVDEDWNVTCIVDLEWMCSLPIEMCRIPPWLTDKAVDEIAEQPEEYGRLRQELVDTLAAEEAKLFGPNEAGAQQHRLSMVMNQGWELGTFWYSLALRSPTGLHALFYKQIQPRFLKKCPEHTEFDNIVPWYWRTDFLEVAIKKMEDKKNYDMQLREAFDKDEAP
ncbi:hypothetical protein D8B26_000799 [Coccidioides posadasii str. Silveira]|uniref:uncharacterized protein n=1 Tax=Coccidioides posadasii (strain RMSCC 757 / Silveira) TaxID=443226 RepID=UPI001BF0A19F|nr:hypothetical protein D8B26_000799 [Coccidioides posadasii str. Silveira]